MATREIAVSLAAKLSAERREQRSDGHNGKHPSPKLTKALKADAGDRVEHGATAEIAKPWIAASRLGFGVEKRGLD
jgi:hypothetical protein